METTSSFPGILNDSGILVDRESRKVLNSQDSQDSRFPEGRESRSGIQPRPVFLDHSDPVAVAWPALILLTSDDLALMAAGNDHLKQRKPSKAARSIADETAPTLNLESRS